MTQQVKYEDELMVVSVRRYNEMIDSLLRINLMLERQCLELEKAVRTMQFRPVEQPSPPMQGRR